MELIAAYLSRTLVSTLPQEITEDKIHELSDFGWFDYGPRVNDFIHKGIKIEYGDATYRSIVQFKRKTPTSTTFILRRPVPSIVIEIETIEEDEKTSAKVKQTFNGMNFKDSEEFIELGVPKKIINDTVLKLSQSLKMED